MPNTRDKLKIVIEASGKKAAKEIGSFARQSGASLKRMADEAEIAFRRSTKQVFSLKNSLIALAGGYGLKKLSAGFLDAARASENYRVRLKVLLGSVGEGNRLFRAMSAYASKVPFQFEQIMGAATHLAGVMQGGVDEVNQWMPLIGDLAAATGLSLQQTTEQIVRMYSAGAASADLFRERGITAMLGFQAGVSYSAEETRKKLMEAWTAPTSKFRGATNELAVTWDGAMTMMADKWFEFRTLIMGAGVYDELKTQLASLNKETAKWIANNRDLIKQKVPEYVRSIKSAVSATVNIYKGLPEGVLKAGLVVAILGRASVVGRVAAALVFLNDQMKHFNLNIGSLKEKYKDYEEAVGNIWDVISGKRDWRTGREIGPSGGRIVRGKIPKPPPHPGSGATTRAGTPPAKPKEKPPEETAAEESRRRMRKDTREYLEWHLKQMEKNGATIRDLERERWEWEKRYTEDALKGMSIGWLEYLDDIKTITQRMADLSRATAQSMEQSFSDYFFDAMTGKLKSFGDYVTSFLHSVARALSGLLAQQAVSGIGGWIGGAFGARTSTAPTTPTQGVVVHAGGIIGRTALPLRAVPPGLFASAPRLHGGLAADEYPAILQRGEAVIPRNQVGSRPNITVNIINRGREEKKAEVSGVRFDLRQWVIDVVLSDIGENGPLRQALGAGAT